ncbi:MAG: peptidoglycan DD-metalloendopeptidase family protein [Deltaproteobacteria bacterium]|nr:peptidoglycan DD-metalloendopeptidase family protein [Deltaproteobacteria bacterium]
MDYYFKKSKRIGTGSSALNATKQGKGIGSVLRFISLISFVTFLAIFINFFLSSPAKTSVSHDDSSALEQEAVELPAEPKELRSLQVTQDKVAKQCDTNDIETYKVKLKSRDTLASTLTSLGFSPTVVGRVCARAGKVSNLTRLRSGQEIVVTALDGVLERVDFRYGKFESVFVERIEKIDGVENSQTGDDYFATKITIPVKNRLKTVSSTIENSLYEDGLSAGATPNIIMGLTDLFAWDVDFATDIQKGSFFRVYYQSTLSESGDRLRDKILGAEIATNGKKSYAYYYTDEEGRGDYYDENGQSLERTLLRSPLRYSRISSYFSKRRFHPIHKKYKAHHGIDYAAPSGTPVESSGDGKVIYAGWKGGYGNYVVIRHNSKYTTAYGHFSRIKKGIKKGKYVRQGDVIGYVGSTGISTGPHLHYEVRVRGKVVNPLNVKSSPRKQLKGEALESFITAREEVIRSMYDLEKVAAREEEAPTTLR